jgi:hypothetical protein
MRAIARPSSHQITLIAIDCLKCGHCTSISEEKQLAFGLEPKALLVTLTIGSSARYAEARAFRHSATSKTLMGRLWCRNNDVLAQHNDVHAQHKALAQPDTLHLT